jgi:hypothetical protein
MRFLTRESHNIENTKEMRNCPLFFEIQETERENFKSEVFVGYRHGRRFFVKNRL